MAEIEFEPTGRALVEIEQRPAERVQVPRVTELALKVTLPVVVGETTAVRVRMPPKVRLELLAVSVVALGVRTAGGT